MISDLNVGKFIVSLDCELYWGVRDKRSLESYRNNLLGDREAIPRLLRLFETYGIHCTFAMVGFLFFDNKSDLNNCIPKILPNYKATQLDPYAHINSIGLNEKDDPFHYGLSLIREILKYPYQEIGSHTFSHYYCLENGQTIDAFKEDLTSAVCAANKLGISLKSIVFPRNQCSKEHIAVLPHFGIHAFRGNELCWFYSPKAETGNSLIRRALRLVDAYVNISGHNSYELKELAHFFPFNIPSSRFLRPYCSKMRVLEKLRLKRILSDLTYAAKNARLYHLWWHPHNFGSNKEENFCFLEEILSHYKSLKEKYGMCSCNMREITSELEMLGHYDRSNI